MAMSSTGSQTATGGAAAAVRSHDRASGRHRAAAAIWISADVMGSLTWMGRMDADYGEKLHRPLGDDAQFSEELLGPLQVGQVGHVDAGVVDVLEGL